MIARFLLAGIDWTLENDWRIAGRFVGAMLVAIAVSRVLP